MSEAKGRDQLAKEHGLSYELRGWGDWAPPIARASFVSGWDARDEEVKAIK